MAHTIPTSNTVAVGFYRGESANLAKLTSYKDGAFYITTDTNRLYYAQSSSNLVQLNKSIQVVTSFPTTGQLDGEFYYNTSTQQLAYYGGKKDGVDQWIHVNYYENTSIKSASISDATLDATNKKLTFALSIQQQDKDSGTEGIAAVTDSFEITADQINALVVHPDIPDLGDIQVTLGATISTNKATVAIGGTGAHASDNSFTIEGKGDVTVEGSADKIEISALSYNITNKTGTNNAAEAAITLKNSDNAAKGKISFTDDDKDIVITATDGAINVAHKTYSGTSKDGSGLTTGAVANGGTVTVVKGVDLSNGHVTGIRTGSFTLPTIPDDNYATDVDADNKGVITITMKNGGKVQSGTLNADNTRIGDLYYTINGNTIYNQGDLTDDVKEIIEENLSKLTNAMTFKGSLTGGTTAAAKVSISTLVTSASIGDVYIVKSGFIGVDDFADSEDIAGIGDMIIASSSDDTETNGVIPAEKLRWTVIEGTEVDTTYALSAASNKLTLTPSAGNAQNITLDDDDIVTLTSAGNKITANHKTYAGGVEGKSGATEKTLAFGGTDSIDVIVGYDDDGHGHVEKLYKTALKLPALPDQTNDHTLTVASNKITLKNAAGTEKGSATIEGGTALTASTSGTKITIDHDNVTRTDPTKAAKSVLTDGTAFSVVTGVTTNAQGHVTAVSTAEYEAQDTKYQLSGATVSASNNVATVTDTLKTTDNAAAGTSVFKLASKNDNLTVTKDASVTNQINMTLIWGTF
jgi:hypothetical protein